MARTRWSCERIAAELRELDAAGVIKVRHIGDGEKKERV